MGNPLEMGRADPNEPERRILREPDCLCAGKDLPRRGLGCDPSREVDRPPEHVAILGDDGTCMDADVGRGEARPAELTRKAGPGAGRR